MPADHPLLGYGDPSAAGEALNRLVEQTQTGAGYRSMDAGLVRRVAMREGAHTRDQRAAVKATRSRLHQVAGAYLPQPHYAAWLADLRAAAPASAAPGLEEDTPWPEALRQVMRQVMRGHASTRERLPILDDFYRETLAEIGPIRSVVDVACGLNPLTIPWMTPLAPGARYRAYDIFTDLTGFLNSVFALMAPYVQGIAETRDALAGLPNERANLALILKTIPCLEQLDKTAGERLLRSVQADHLLVSFPARSLGGRQKGMERHYEAHFYDLLEQVGGSAWQVRRFSFGAELAFLVSR